MSRLSKEPTSRKFLLFTLVLLYNIMYTAASVPLNNLVPVFTRMLYEVSIRVKEAMHCDPLKIKSILDHISALRKLTFHWGTASVYLLVYP